jgi:hypothetical protein
MGKGAFEQSASCMNHPAMATRWSEGRTGRKLTILPDFRQLLMMIIQLLIEEKP